MDFEKEIRPTGVIPSEASPEDPLRPKPANRISHRKGSQAAGAGRETPVVRDQIQSSEAQQKHQHFQPRRPLVKPVKFHPPCIGWRYLIDFAHLGAHAAIFGATTICEARVSSSISTIRMLRGAAGWAFPVARYAW